MYSNFFSVQTLVLALMGFVLLVVVPTTSSSTTSSISVVSKITHIGSAMRYFTCDCQLLSGLFLPLILH